MNPPALDADAKPAPQRPGAAWYLLGLVLLVGGAGAFIFSLSVDQQRITERIDAMARITLPEGGAVALDAPGEYALFYEGPADRDAERIAYAELLDPALVIRPVSATGTDVDAPRDRVLIEVKPVEAVEAYPRDGRNGMSIARFEAPEAGRYRITGRLAPGDHAESIIAVGQLNLRDVMGRWDGVFGGAVAATLGFTGGSVILILTLMLRRRQFTTRDD